MAESNNETEIGSLPHKNTNVNNVKKDEQPQTNEFVKENIIPIHKQISDVAQFSYAALCATALHSLFETDQDGKFREETFALILIALEQPQQVCESVRAMLQGQGLDEMDPYIDILLAEDVLKSGAEAIISQLLAIGIGQGCYDARMRVFIKHLAWRLKVSWDTVNDLEAGISETLALSDYEMSDDENEVENSEEKLEKKKKAKRRKIKRFALIGLATLGGGTLIGLTGGLAAPLVAAGAGAIIGGAGAAVLGSTAGVAIIGSLFGVAGAGLTGYKMKKRVGAIEEFEFEPLVCGNSLRADTLSNQLHITVAVTGWLTNEFRDFRQPWRNLAESREQYALKWETKYLVQMGEAMDYIFNSAMTMATQEALKYTVLEGLLAAVAWPSALLSVANLIDNPWSVALQRSQTAGKELAEVLLARQQGNRPVTLIGFSLGARVIFSCLEELVKRKGSEGIVEDVILLGTPATGDPKVWANFAKVVAGKIVNGYCRGDWLLKFLYRTSSIQLSIAGLRPIKWVDRRMHNIDLSDVVSGHLDYRKQLDIIMKAVGVQTRDELLQSSLPSSNAVSPAHKPGQGPSTVDLSSSDDEAQDKNWVIIPDIPAPPVILEDYSQAGKTQVREDVIPCSASFDSGVDISKVPESESVDRLAGVEQVASPVGGDQAGNLTASASNVNESVDLSLCKPADRIGDAGAGEEEDEARESLDDADVLRETQEDEASTLQRKKMFDSMYRLVLDDDLMDVMNDDDDYLPETDGSS
ncbi:transmembrane and coiled-coil domain-containing protein 4-like [Physella acuta]|uniref:transmembrane and coiled-coil domain-containing protein 4-like n=1 Tax=Physella acuta TaxID=109671 RepID=UPI0027DD2D15|nr:transmembrane and coiled-coil domain-containing protein 4-like [Physella acuta]